MRKNTEGVAQNDNVRQVQNLAHVNWQTFNGQEQANRNTHRNEVRIHSTKMLLPKIFFDKFKELFFQSFSYISQLSKRNFITF